MEWVLWMLALICAAFIGAKLMDNLWQGKIKELLGWRKNEAEQLRAELRRDPDSMGKNHLALRITTCDHQVHLLEDLLRSRKEHFK